MFGHYFGAWICAAAPLIAGLILKFFPPKKINHILGFGTRRTMVNQETWVYSHKVCANCLLIYCAVSLPIFAALLAIFSRLIESQLAYVFLYGVGFGLLAVVPTTIIVQIKAKKFSDKLAEQKESVLPEPVEFEPKT